VTHLVLVQDLTVDIIHDENTEKLFEVRGTRDIRYEIVKKRIDKAVDEKHALASPNQECSLWSIPPKKSGQNINNTCAT
jgi:hypothetical protein